MPRWTPEARKLQSEKIRTWQPWKNSTGPRTDAGKARSAENRYGRWEMSEGELETRRRCQAVIDEARDFSLLLETLKRSKRRRR